MSKQMHWAGLIIVCMTDQRPLKRLSDSKFLDGKHSQHILTKYYKDNINNNIK